MNFFDKLKSETDTLHLIAERTGFNLDLYRGNITRELYGKYLINKYHLYNELEIILNELSYIDEISQFNIPELKRSDYIQKDIESLLKDLITQIHLTKSIESYIYHIKKIAKNNPLLLIAHTYTNYLADLSGGIIIKGILKKNYNLDERELNSYNFEISDIGNFKKEYKNKMAIIIEKHNIENEIIEEVKLAFIFFIAFLNEIVFKK